MKFGGRYVSMNFNVVYNVIFIDHVRYPQKVLSHFFIPTPSSSSNLSSHTLVLRH